MPHTEPKVASKRLVRFRERAARLRRMVKDASGEKRALLLEQAQMFERLVEAAERDSNGPEQSKTSGRSNGSV